MICKMNLHVEEVILQCNFIHSSISCCDYEFCFKKNYVPHLHTILKYVDWSCKIKTCIAFLGLNTLKIQKLWFVVFIVNISPHLEDVYKNTWTFYIQMIFRHFHPHMPQRDPHYDNVQVQSMESILTLKKILNKFYIVKMFPSLPLVVLVNYIPRAGFIAIIWFFVILSMGFSKTQLKMAPRVN